MKAKENNKETQSFKVNSTPDLVKSSEHVILADTEAANKELEAATSINSEKRKICIEHSITHKG